MSDIHLLRSKLSREEKIAGLKNALEKLYAMQVEISLHILAHYAARNLNIRPQTMRNFIGDLKFEERRYIGIPHFTGGRGGIAWYRNDGTPNRPQQ